MAENASSDCRAVLYVGPSLLAHDLAAIDQFAIDVRAPIRRGDLPKLVECSRIQMVAIVDGEFYQSLAVSPKEILLALSHNVVILGGGSMGAMRAAEMFPYGMRGIGQIYKWYKSGFIYRDDDVAISYCKGPADYLTLTTPMVNVIWVALEGKRQQWLTSKGARIVVNAARRVHWKERTWENLLDAIKIDECERHALIAFVANPDNDLKRLDALRVVAEVASLTQICAH